MFMLACAAFAGAAMAQQPDPFRILRHDVIVDVPNEEAVFNLWFSDVPDLNTFDSDGRQATSFLFSLSEPDIRNFTRRQRGDPEIAHPYVRVGSGEVATGGRAVARVVTPGWEPWGPIVATADLRQLGRRVTFRLPLSIFDEGGLKPYRNDSWFAVHYFLEAFRFGYTTYTLRRNVAIVGTVEARLQVKSREVRTGHGAKRRLLIAQIMSVPSTENEQSDFVNPEFVDVATVRFGPYRARPLGNELKDVNGDGFEDLVLTFDSADVGLSCIDTDVRITGEIPLPGNFVPEGTVFVGKASLPPCK
jgi:hypothetical protein